MSTEASGLDRVSVFMTARGLGIPEQHVSHVMREDLCRSKNASEHKAIVSTHIAPAVILIQSTLVPGACHLGSKTVALLTACGIEYEIHGQGSTRLCCRVPFSEYARLEPFVHIFHLIIAFHLPSRRLPTSKFTESFSSSTRCRFVDSRWEILLRCLIASVVVGIAVREAVSSHWCHGRSMKRLTVPPPSIPRLR